MTSLNYNFELSYHATKRIAQRGLPRPGQVCDRLKKASKSIRKRIGSVCSDYNRKTCKYIVTTGNPTIVYVCREMKERPGTLLVITAFRLV